MGNGTAPTVEYAVEKCLPGVDVFAYIANEEIPLLEVGNYFEELEDESVERITNEESDAEELNELLEFILEYENSDNFQMDSIEANEIGNYAAQSETTTTPNCMAVVDEVIDRMKLHNIQPSTLTTATVEDLYKMNDSVVQCSDSHKFNGTSDMMDIGND